MSGRDRSDPATWFDAALLVAVVGPTIALALLAVVKIAGALV